MKYFKVIDGLNSNASGFKYKIGEVNIAPNWNPTADNPKDFGGFNFSNEESILRWLLRGNIIYDVIIPNDAEVVAVDSQSAPNGVFRTNKIIIENPRVVTDEVACDLYMKSKLPEKSYFQILAYLACQNFSVTCNAIIEDHLTTSNAKEALEIYDNFLSIRTDPMPDLYIEVLNIIKKSKN